jgi:hypothetical protein
VTDVKWGPTGELVWKPIDGFKGRYEVSSEGQVRSWNRKGPGDGRNDAPKLLSHHVDRGGYHNITLFLPGGKRVRKMVHRLVLEAFFGACPEGLEASHIDGNPHNNSVENLCWKPHLDNIRDKYEHGTMFYGTRNDSRKKVVA